MSTVFSSCDFVAGWASGVLGLIVGHPLDTIKVWSQTLPGKSSSLKIISTIYKHEGVKGYYKGMMFPLLSAGALNSLFFGTYGNALRQVQSVRGVEQTMCWFQEKPYPQWYWDIFFAGCLGGLACSVITCPVDLVKTQMQTQTNQQEVKVFARTHIFKSPWECFVYQFKTNGIKGVYKGMVPLLWRDIPGTGLYVLSYEWFICLRGQNRTKNHPSAVINHMLGGAVAGVMSWGTVLPFDVLKSRIQADSQSHPKYRGMWDCIVKSYRNEGIEIFFRGFWLVILRSMPVNAAVDVTASGVYMLVYAKSCQQLSEKEHWAVMLAGANAGMVSWSVIVPLDVIKTRIQADSISNPKYQGIVDCALQSYRAKGLTVFFRGFWLIILRSLPVNAVTFLGDVAAAGVYMTVYAKSCQQLQHMQEHWAVMLAGGNAGMWCWTISLPLDVIKSRIQADSISNPKYRGMVDCVIKSYRGEGLSVFVRGLWLIIIRAWPVNAVTFAGYEYFLSFCKNL